MIPQYLSIDSDSARSSISTSPTDIDSYEAWDDFVRLDHDPELAASSDPLWVARPRNAFIIFRCEYARRHSRMGRRARGIGAPAEKSLSKRAAEAWHQLSNEEKGYFKALADQERIEHARLYPYYRFRPARRPSSKRSPHPRVVSMTNLLEQCSDQDVERESEAMPKSSTRDISIHDVPDSTSSSCSLSSYDPSPLKTHPFDVCCQRGSAGHLTQLPMTPSIPWLSQPGSIRPILTQSDINSVSVDDFFYLENTLPPIPQHHGYMNADYVSLRSSSLANWDGKATADAAPCSRQFPESTPAYIRPEDDCDDIFDNIGIGYDALFGYSACQDHGANITIPYHPIHTDLHIAEARRVTVPVLEPERRFISYPFSTFHEVGVRIDALLYHL